MDHPLLGNTTPLTLNYITDASPAAIRKGTVSREGIFRVQKLNQNFTFCTSSVPEFIDPVFKKTSPKRSFSLNRKRAFWLVFVKTGSIISGTDGFHNIVAFLWRKLKIKLLLASMKPLQILKYATLYRKLVPAFRYSLASATLKVVPKAACDSKNCSESRLSNVHWKKFAIERRKAGT